MGPVSALQVTALDLRRPSVVLPEGGAEALPSPPAPADVPAPAVTAAPGEASAIPPAPAAAPAIAPAPAPEPSPAPARRSRRLLLAAAALFVLVGICWKFGWYPGALGGSGRKPPVTNGLGMELAWVPAGKFTMGSPASEAGRREDEGPPHPVAIARPFYLATRETTVAQFGAFVQAAGYRTEAEKAGGALHWDESRKAWQIERTCTWRTPGWRQDDAEPVVCVSRFDALAFCYWLGRKEGRVYRLPTEAEWEYACRACSTTPFAPGPVLLPGQANFAAGPGRPARVGSFPANAWGLCDLHGNVWEWCADLYGPAYYAESPPRDPPGPERGELGVLRGGSWTSPAPDCRSAARLGVPVASRRTDVGFRVVLEAGVR
jgi:formylglycine-generating enzyme required for sulfatase activity